MTGLRATQAQIQVISANIANAQTPGYSRETLAETSIVAPSGGAGVNTGIIQRTSDSLLQANVTAQSSAASAASTTNTYLTQLQNLLGTVGSNSSFTGALNNFASALQTAAATPEDPVAESAAVNAGQQLAQQLNSFSSGIQSLRSDTDSDLGTSITTLTNALTSIGTLNADISQVQAQGQSTATLQDQRDQALATVAGLTGVSAYTRSDGSMVVMTTSGQTLVDGSAVSQFTYTPSGTVTAGTPLSPITLNGVDVTSKMNTTGSIGALLQMRDTTLPSMTAELNQFSNNLYNVTTNSNLNTTNSGLNTTNDANHFFSNVNLTSGVDNSATIEVNPSLVQNAALLYNGTSGNDPTILSSMSSALNSSVTFAAAGNFPSASNTTLAGYGAQIIGQAATAASAAGQNNTYQTQLQTTMQNQLSSETGVNLDQELGNLTIYQNAYGASARVVTTIQAMYDTLMQIGQ